MHDLPRPAVRVQERRSVQTRQEPPTLLPGPARRQVGAHRNELLEALGRVCILGRRRHDIHDTQVQADQHGGRQGLGGASSPIFDAGEATPGITPPTGVGLVPCGPPCSPERSTDAGPTPSDPEEDILALDRDTLTMTRDALSFCPRSPPTPDLFQGTRWEQGMVGLVTVPTRLGDKVRVGKTNQGGGAHVRPLRHRGAHSPPRY